MKNFLPDLLDLRPNPMLSALRRRWGTLGALGLPNGPQIGHSPRGGVCAAMIARLSATLATPPSEITYCSATVGFALTTRFLK
jgi:hypothetical protein